MRQDTLSVDFRYSYKNNGNDVFHYDVEASLNVASEIMLQNVDINGIIRNAVPAYYIPALHRLVISDSSMYWEVNKTVLSAKNIYSGASIADMFAHSETSEQHRMVFGGRNLGTSVTTEQINAVRNGTFTGLLVGDYWVINDMNWRIADIDYWYGCGDTAFNSHHLVIIPDSIMAEESMNATATTSDGYTGSVMYTESLPVIKDTCDIAFPNMILTHREYLVSAVTNGKPSSAGWVNSNVDLLSEIMTYGCHILSPCDDGITVSALGTVSKQQIALFNLVPRFIKCNKGYWLRDPVSNAHFAIVHDHGYALYRGAGTICGVRPVFAIG